MVGLNVLIKRCVSSAPNSVYVEPSLAKRCIERNDKKVSKEMDVELKEYLSRELNSFNTLCNPL
jgi:hypothetical protein